MRRLYTALLWLAMPAVVLSLLWRGVREREYWRGGWQRFGLGFGDACANGRCIWVHAVSMGEVQAAAPLVAALRGHGFEVLLTSATPTGRQRAEQSCGTQAAVRYAPYDLPGAVRRVLRATRPCLLIVLETELWPNTLHACARAGVPVLAASARLSARTAGRLARWPGLISPAALANLQVAAQTAADAERYCRLGVPADAVRVCGNLKFDRVAAPGTSARGQVLRQALAPARALWVAGSTHPVEEDAVLAAHRALLAQRAALLVLAPRHPRRFAEVAARLAGEGWRYARRGGPSSGVVGAVAGADVLLLDSMGELADFYAAADLAYVGGSLVPAGGHNLLEPATVGVAVATGPLHASAPEVFAALRVAEAVCVAEDAAALPGVVMRLLTDPAGRNRLAANAAAVLQANRGSLDQIVAWALRLAG